MDISNRLRFWANTNPPQWNSGGQLNKLNIVSNKLTDRLTSQMQSLYDFSPRVQSLLGQIRNSYINFASTQETTATVSAAIPNQFDSFIRVNSIEYSTLFTFTHDGRFVKEDERLGLAHELSHLINKTSDPIGYQNGTILTDSIMNGAYYEYKGDAVKFENLVSVDLGAAQDMRASYEATMTISNARAAYIQNVSYTLGNYVEIVRFGDFLSNNQTVTSNNIDVSSREDNASILAFGFTGVDTLRGGVGNDFLYGGDGGGHYLWRRRHRPLVWRERRRRRRRCSAERRLC